jgi:hypothetical protein
LTNDNIIEMGLMEIEKSLCMGLEACD